MNSTEPIVPLSQSTTRLAYRVREITNIQWKQPVIILPQNQTINFNLPVACQSLLQE